MLTTKLLSRGLCIRQPSIDLSTGRESITPFSRLGNSLTVDIRKTLFATTVLVSGLMFATTDSSAILIQNGAIETIIGTGGGTIASPSNPGNLAIGAVGDGTLNISAGGIFTTNNASFFGINANVTGTVNITDANSIWNSGGNLTIGRAGNGVLNLTSGGKATSLLSVIYVGNLNGSQGTVTVDGASSELISKELYVGDNGTGNATISNGGTITTTQFALVGLAPSGNGTVTVTGNNSSWTIGNRARIGDNGPGTLIISEGATVSAASDFTVAANNLSTGTVVIGATSGNPAVAAGTLNTSILSFGTGTGNLLFNHTEISHVFTPGVEGAGTIENAAGTTKLTGNFNAFTGTINANGGKLYINTNVPNAMAINVNNGGYLGGSGTLSTLSINNGGTLAPGNSIGTLNISGNASFASGSTYAVEIDNAGNSDLLNVGGTLTISSGASVTISPENGTDTGVNYTPGQVYTIATAVGGVSGRFGTVTNTFAFLDASLSYNANNVLFTVKQDADFVSVAATTNQAAVAVAAQATGAGNAVFDALVGLNASTARNAFDQLSGEIHASARSVFIENSRYLRRAALSRLTRKTSPENQLWGKFYGGYTSLKGNNNAAPVKGRTGGFIAGYDADIDNWRFGGAGQIGRTNVSVSDRENSGKSTDFGASLYASTEFDRTRFAFGGAFTRHNISTNRTVAFGGLSETLNGDYHASTAQIFGKISHNFKLDEATVTPFAKATYIMHNTDGINETGGAAALSSSNDTHRSTFVTLGVDVVREFTNTNGMPAKLYGTVGWRHAFNGNNQITNNFAGGSSFAVQGAAVSKNAFVIDAGLDFALNETVDFGIGYSGQIGSSGNHVHSAKAVLSAKF